MLKTFFVLIGVIIDAIPVIARNRTDVNSMGFETKFNFNFRGLQSNNLMLVEQIANLPLKEKGRKRLQDDTSGCSPGFVDTKAKVALHNIY
mgnify:CR=1 FL=1